MTYHRTKEEMTEIRAEQHPIIHQRIPEPTKTKQYCIHESDKRLREKIRGMDDRERMVVMDEIRKIYEDRKAEQYAGIC